MRLQSVLLRDFRSIGGAHEVPLNASIVLIHGGNGAGKTSLLSAIELALTGEVGYMARVDSGYKGYLAHNQSRSASVTLTCETSGSPISAGVDQSNGWTGRPMLSGAAAAEFVERNFLAQAQLSRLLEVYQTVDASKESALSRFVRELLRLDEVDALIEGLEFTRDLRNTRRLVPGWEEHDRDIAALEPHLFKLKQQEAQLAEDVASRRAWLYELVRRSSHDPEELSELAKGIGGVDFRLGDKGEQELREASVAKSRLTTLRRGFQRLVAPAPDGLADAPNVERTAAADLSSWWSTAGREIEVVLDEVRLSYPEVPEPRVTGPVRALQIARGVVEAERNHSKGLLDQAEHSLATRAHAEDRLLKAEKELQALQDEREGLAPSSNTLLASLSELVGLIDNDICPVCGRDYAEVSEHGLQGHLAQRLANDLRAAERLVGASNRIAACERDIATLRSLISEHGSPDVLKYRDLFERSGKDLRRLDSKQAAAERGGRLIEQDASAAGELRQLMVDHEEWAKYEALLASMEEAAGVVDIASGDVYARIDALESLWSGREEAVSANAALITEAHEANQALTSIAEDLASIAAEVKSGEADLARLQIELRRAEILRDGAKKSRDNLIKFRTDIVRRVFSESFNTLWRDMFSRLAPGEPFTPAFEVTSRTGLPTEVKLETRDELGNPAGSPGAMLSAGNINTAALTLFLALHFSAAIEQPVLILDDPVQSMDDVHISQLAALLRTISSAKHRQVILAVHDRNLFEYLRLELSPASRNDSLITVELDRSANATTRVRAARVRWKDDQIAITG